MTLSGLTQPGILHSITLNHTADSRTLWFLGLQLKSLGKLHVVGFSRLTGAVKVTSDCRKFYW